MQFYFLSIVANIVAGSVLASEYLAERFAALGWLKVQAERRNVRLVAGLGAAVIGFFKLLVAAPPGPVFVGDFAPAIVGLATGAALIAGTLRDESDTDAIQKFDEAISAYRVPIGLGAIVVGGLHFFFPGAFLL